LADAPATLTTDNRVQRNTKLLMAAQIGLWGAIGTLAANAPLAIVALTHRR
jgi:hypothetical protein